MRKFLAAAALLCAVTFAWPTEAKANTNFFFTQTPVTVVSNTGFFNTFFVPTNAVLTPAFVNPFFTPFFNPFFNTNVVVVRNHGVHGRVFVNGGRVRVRVRR